MPCEPKTAVCYARYSSAGQRDVSIDQQLRDLHAYAAAHGYTIARDYCDHAKSGFKNVKSRSAFQRLMADAEAGNFDTVLVWKVDRFGRSREDSAIYKGRLRRHGVSVIYAMEPIPEGAAGVLLEGMLEATAEWYSRNLSENVLRGMTDNARNCLFNGHPVLGYCRGPDGRYAVDPLTAPTVRSIFNQYAAGLPAAAISRALNASGLRTARGSAWTPEAVLRILSNDRYIGVYRWGQIRVPDGMPVLIPAAQFEEVQTRMKNTRRSVHQDTAADYILTGKLFCGHCGAAMVGDSGTSSTGARYYYYSCLNHKRARSCPKRSHKKQPLEDLIIDYLLDHVLTPCTIEYLADQVLAEQKKRAASSPLPGLESEYAAIQKQLKNINLAIAQGIWSESTAALLHDLEQQAAALRESIAQQKSMEADLASRDMVVFFLSRFRTSDRTDPVVRSRLINTFVNAIYLYDDHLRLLVNTIESASIVPLSDLPPERSDSFTLGAPIAAHPNVFLFRIAI